MAELLHHFIGRQALRTPNATAIIYRDRVISYSELNTQITAVAAGFISLGLEPSERIAVYLPKLPETIFSLFGTSKAGGAFIPVNALLKPKQVTYILKNANARILITSSGRLQQLSDALHNCHDLHTVIVIDDTSLSEKPSHSFLIINWAQLTSSSIETTCHHRIDNDMAALLYTSGSTGYPKGVMLSHRNMVMGAKSVAKYLEIQPEDRLLAVLPLSFDYGLSQITTALCMGASAVLMDYLVPQDILRIIKQRQITGLAAVPSLWIQLAQLEWPQEIAQQLRFVTNSGGTIPKIILSKLQKLLPDSKIYLMYGLTESFRSTYLPPNEVKIRPDSIGKAIPNAEVMVIRDDGTPCAPGEPGELVHRGALVAMGYWDNAKKTKERFRPAPLQSKTIMIPEIAVWSGDTVKADKDGYLYFIGRKDDMIKTSGYRVSPIEIEEVIYSSELVSEAVALGIPHPTLGQAILIIAAPNKGVALNEKKIAAHCKKELPNFMQPSAIIKQYVLPRNPNGKIDRKKLCEEYQDIFSQD